VVVLDQPASPAAEAYRSLRTAVHFALANRTRCIAITTVRTRNGKTETAANLAVLTAQMGQRTVLVDCDMRRPRVNEFFGIPNDTGFTSVVSGESDTDSVRRIAGNDPLFALTTGPIPPNPAELLASPRSQEVLAGLHAKKKSSRRRARVTEHPDDNGVRNTLVIVDTPPLLLATDALVLAPALGGILLVVTARTTRKKELRKALELLRQVDAPLLGMVLHSADSAETGGFGEERNGRERRQAHRRRELNGATAAEPADSIAEPAPMIVEPAQTDAEPAHPVVRWVPPNGASAEAVDAERE
jgi:Mrp family chromosome partitioning ATPase